LAYLGLFWRLHQYGPSESERAEHFRVSARSLHKMIVNLEEKGLVTREPGVPRSVQVAVPRSAGGQYLTSLLGPTPAVISSLRVNSIR
jgi:DNA-binding MarR family transcriptional regulator